MPSFSLLHIPPLFIATAFTFGGAIPLFSPQRAIREFGLPEHIAVSTEAHPCFTVYGSRMTAFGMAIWIFYFQGSLKAIDTILTLMLYVSMVDAWVCLQEGVRATAVFRLGAGVVVGGWGLLGLTSR